jgi:hypothetical protein
MDDQRTSLASRLRNSFIRGAISSARRTAFKL